MRSKSLILGCIPVSLTALLYGCGAPHQPITSPSSSKSSSSNDSAVTNDAVTPPKEYYDALLADRMLALDQGTLATHSQQILWINFDGATVTKGYNRNQSFIVCAKTATIPVSGYSPTEQTQIVHQVAQYFSNAGVDVGITFDKPSVGDFTTLNVGGKYSDLGCGASSSTLGIAPFDVDNANPNDIGFAFVPANKDLTIQALTIAHEAAHSFGLDHSDNHVDIMYPIATSQETGFAIGNAGRSSQNGPLILQKNLGVGFASVSGSPIQPSGAIPTPVPSVAPVIPTFPNTPANNPTVAGLPGIPGLGGLSQILLQLNPAMISSLSPLLPALGALPAGISLNNPQTILSALTLFQNGVTKQNGGTFNLGSVMSTLSGPKSTSFGSAIFSILGAATGNPASIAGVLAPIILNKIGSKQAATPAATQTTTQPCDVAALLGMTTVTNQGSLIALIPKYAQVIRVNASGSQAQALNDAVKLAIGQTYLSIGNVQKP